MRNTNKDKALFIDLDNVLVTTQTGREYPIHSKDWKFVIPALDAVKSFYNKGFLICIISNQSLIEEGLLNETVFINRIESICRVIESQLNIQPQSIMYSYCSKINNFHKMPNPGMIYEMAVDFELHLKDSVLLSSHLLGKALGINTGIDTVYNLTDLHSINWLNK